MLGIDLACQSWADNGSALLTFGGVPSAWRVCEVGIVRWPDAPLSPATMARAIDEFAIAHGVQAVSIDGPQGWRSPLAGSRAGVGRLCEYEARTPGKTGEFETTYPGNYAGWVRFSIAVFEELLSLGRATLANEPEAALPMSVSDAGRYVLLECFPTSTWRCSGLVPLPGHRNAPPDVVEDHAAKLRDRYGLPATAITRHHDNLQAVVAALPAAALVGGPCEAISRGQPGVPQAALGDTPEHWVEGIIWDARPREVIKPAMRPGSQPCTPGDVTPGGATTVDEEDAKNLILPDERDAASEEVLERGVLLFQKLVQCANAGHSLGIGYADFVRWVYDVDDYAKVAGEKYLPSHSGYVVRLAQHITEAAGGRQKVTKNGVTIESGMDSFIWQKSGNHDRSPKAWESRWSPLPYTRGDWLKVFPHGNRKLLDLAHRGDPLCPEGT